MKDILIPEQKNKEIQTMHLDYLLRFGVTFLSEYLITVS